MNSETNGIDSTVKPSTQTISVAYPTLSSVPVLAASTIPKSQVMRIFPAQTNTKSLVGTPHTDSVSSSNGSLTRHVPVMQVTREPTLRRGNSDTKIVKASRPLVKTSSQKLSVNTTTTTPTVSSGMDAASQEEESSSPGSKEILAANVLAEGFALKI